MSDVNFNKLLIWVNALVPLGLLEAQREVAVVFGAAEIRQLAEAQPEDPVDQRVGEVEVVAVGHVLDGTAVGAVVVSDPTGVRRPVPRCDRLHPPVSFAGSSPVAPVVVFALQPALSSMKATSVIVKRLIAQSRLVPPGHPTLP